MEASWLVIRDDDLVAEKLENMLLESLRSFGDAGDSGGWWKGAFGGDANSAPFRSPGDLGLFGLMGVLAPSLAPLPRIASDKVDDLGILRSCFGRGLGGCACLAQALPRVGWWPPLFERGSKSQVPRGSPRSGGK
jgi:hypothetical protein